jgi:phosphotransacetylase
MMETAVRSTIQKATLKERAVMFTMPKLETAGDAVKATAALAEAVANGDITPGSQGRG